VRIVPAVKKVAMGKGEYPAGARIEELTIQTLGGPQQAARYLYKDATRAHMDHPTYLRDNLNALLFAKWGHDPEMDKRAVAELKRGGRLQAMYGNAAPPARAGRCAQGRPAGRVNWYA
jgi:hypothetical protein